MEWVPLSDNETDELKLYVKQEGCYLTLLEVDKDKPVSILHGTWIALLPSEVEALKSYLDMDKLEAENQRLREEVKALKAFTEDRRRSTPVNPIW